MRKILYWFEVHIPMSDPGSFLAIESKQLHLGSKILERAAARIEILETCHNDNNDDFRSTQALFARYYLIRAFLVISPLQHFKRTGANVYLVIASGETPSC